MCKWFSTILIIVLWSVYYSIVCMQPGVQMLALYNDRTMKMKRKLLIDSNIWPHTSIKVLRFPQNAKFTLKISQMEDMIIFMCI